MVDTIRHPHPAAVRSDQTVTIDRHFYALHPTRRRIHH